MLPSHWSSKNCLQTHSKHTYVRSKHTSNESVVASATNAVSFARRTSGETPASQGARGTSEHGRRKKCASPLRASLHAHTYTRTVKAESFGLSAHFHGVRGIACTRQESTRWWLLLVGGIGRLVSWPERAPTVDRLVGRPPRPSVLSGSRRMSRHRFAGRPVYDRASGGCGGGADGEGS